ncbi:hypothetical protein [Thalassotalea mangrovi]|uniref:Uncharacterized protein n=1 Tax=Thalassotalea mangrovi TaxID=2572245 RepID=A0A4U1B6B4_9GAMM|nr:hypothetical protein [Thalassotalea mangrovi]TKB45966.1 hypothetical protein E8M12_06910 [Thalassotalea mangrovi]
MNTVSHRFIAVTTYLLLMLSGYTVNAQEDQGDMIVSHCMKSQSADYSDMETKKWLPIHQEMVNQGHMKQWLLYYVMFGDRTDCDYYVVEIYEDADQWRQSDAMRGMTIAKKYGEKEMQNMWQESFDARSMNSSTLWYTLESIGDNEHTFAVFNAMKAENPEDYIKFEREVWQPIHQWLYENKHSAGWSLLSKVAPAGKAVASNFGTVDFLDRFAPTPFWDAMKNVHPDKNPQEIDEMAQSVRDHLYVTTLVKVAGTKKSE